MLGQQLPVVAACWARRAGAAGHLRIPFLLLDRLRGLFAAVTVGVATAMRALLSKNRRGDELARRGWGSDETMHGGHVHVFTT